MVITDMVKVDDIFYCLLESYNGIFRFSEKTKELELEVRFSTQNTNLWLYNKMLVYEEKIVCIPDFASEVAIYDLQRKELKMLPIKTPRIPDPFYDEGHKFKDGCIYENFILMIGAKYPALVRIDMRTYKIEYFDEWVNEMRSMDIYKEPWRLFFRRSGATANGCIYLAGNCASVCLKLDLCTMRHSWIAVCEKNYKSLLDCFAYGDKIWLVPAFHDSLIELDTRQDMCSEYCLSNDVSDGGKALLTEAALLDNILFLYYQMEDKIVMFNVETKKIEKKFFIKGTVKDECKGIARYKFARIIGNHVIAYSRELDRVIRLDKHGEYEFWTLEFESKYLFDIYANDQTVREQKEYQLKNFIEYIGD